MSLEQGAMFFVNPLTAIAFLDIVKKENFKAIVMSAAGSALAKMVLHLAKKAGISFVGLVRKDFQVTDLQTLGATNAINILKVDFENEIIEATSSSLMFGNFAIQGGAYCPSRFIPVRNK